jgi:ZIP family zinc transporter
MFGEGRAHTAGRARVYNRPAADYNRVITGEGLVGFTELLLLGAIAGFTIYLGLPLAAMRSVDRRTRGFLNAGAVGILLFLLFEVMHEVIEAGEHAAEDYFAGKLALETALPVWLAIVGGFALALLGLAWFEQRFILRGAAAGGPAKAQRLALMIATGIGLHNLSEGLAIGQSYATGAIGFAVFLAVGFALHNATEGFGIAGPLAGQRTPAKRLLLLGLIGGGPTFLGTLVGASFASPLLNTLFLALAGGAIVYVVKELLYHGRVEGEDVLMMAGVLLGIFLAFGTELAIELAGG